MRGPHRGSGGEEVIASIVLMPNRLKTAEGLGSAGYRIVRNRRERRSARRRARRFEALGFS